MFQFKVQVGLSFFWAAELFWETGGIYLKIVGEKPVVKKPWLYAQPAKALAYPYICSSCSAFAGLPY